MRPSQSDRGAVLLMVLVVTSILFVVVGQLTRSTFLDRALAGNHLAHTQARLDLQSAIEVFLAAMATPEPPPTIKVDLASGPLTITWKNEAGKFNLNRLRAANDTLATEQFDRLFRLLEDRNLLTVLGLSGPIAEFVTTGSRPVLGLGELLQIEGLTTQVLYGADGGPGLADYLTVYSDGKLNFSVAPLEVLGSLGEGLTNPNATKQLQKKLTDPGATVPGYIAQIANRNRQLLTTSGAAFHGTITLSGRDTNHLVEVAARQENDELRLVLFNELRPQNAQLDQ